MKRLYTTLALTALAAAGASAAGYTATLRIDTADVHQTVRGFGGFTFSATWGNNLTDAEIQTMFGKGQKELGYNLFRARIAPDEYASWGADNWGSTIGVIKKVRDLGAIGFASAWTPPPAYKTNHDYVHGQIDEAHFQDYTDFLNRFIDRCVAAGTDVDYISLQNEPDWNPDYEGCEWTAQNFINYYKQYASQLKRPLIGPESLALRRELSDPILSDPEACAGLAVLGGHLYGGGNFRYPEADAAGKEVWMTEYLINDNASADYKYTWNDALTFAQCVNTSMLADMTAWCHYALKASYGMMGDGTGGNPTGEVTKRGYALAHFAKMVTGQTRVGHTLVDPDYRLRVSAYVNEARDTVTLMIINIATHTYDLTCDLPWLSAGGVRLLTRQSQNMQRTSVAFDQTATPTFTIPASAIVTYQLVKSAPRTDAQTPDKAYVFEDRFTDLCGRNRIPAGWHVQFNGTSYYGGATDYSLYGNNPKMLYYAPEGQIPAGLLLQTSSAAASGLATYGTQAGHTLTLQPGRYRLTFYSIGYNHAQTLYAYVRRNGSGTNIASHAGIQATGVVGIQAGTGGTSTDAKWGTQLNILTATPDTLDFDVTEPGDYNITFKLTYYDSNRVGGSCQALVGGIRLEDITDQASAIDVVRPDDRPATEADDTAPYYDLLGRPVAQPSHGIYIRGGKKIILQ